MPPGVAAPGGPRPHGRGGFKGFINIRPRISNSIPAHTGGVDLRRNILRQFLHDRRPRPHGRGGFKGKM